MDNYTMPDVCNATGDDTISCEEGQRSSSFNLSSVNKWWSEDSKRACTTARQVFVGCESDEDTDICYRLGLYNKFLIEDD